MNRRDTLGAAWASWWMHTWFRIVISWTPWIAVCLTLAFLYFTADAARPPALGPYSDVEVTNPNKLVRLGESVHITSEWCANRPAEVSTEVSLRKIGNGEARQAIELISFTTDRPTGCGPINLSFPIDASLGPGRYYIYGVDSVANSDEIKIWQSEEFRAE